MKKLKGNLYKEGETVTNYNDQDDFEQLPAGAYVCTITSVRDIEDKEYLYVEFDIAEGEHKDFFKRLNERINFWGGRVNLSYSDRNVARSFDKPCKTINANNPGFEFNPHEDGKNSDERTLIGKKIGVVLHEEEYEKDGKVRTSMATYPWGIILIDKLKAGDFNKKLLDKKPLAPQKSSDDSIFTTVPDSETPFN